jgi:hypothetical protein
MSQVVFPDECRTTGMHGHSINSVGGISADAERLGALVPFDVLIDARAAV